MQEIAKDDVLGFVNRGSHTTLTVYPGKRLDNNYSLNTADICPVGALTSKDFRFKMRVWFLKETKSIDGNCGFGTNILIGSRENIIQRITPRENDCVNGPWMPDSHRLAFHPINSDERLKEPLVRGEEPPSKWPRAIEVAASQIHAAGAGGVAIIASGRMTNEELFLVKRLAKATDADLVDLLPRPQPGDGFLISEDGNPNTTGAKLLGLSSTPGSLLPAIAGGIASKKIKVLVCLGENAVDCGISEEALGKLDALIATGILPNRTTVLASVLLPSAAFSEKRGSMINVFGRIQRLNRACTPPGLARDDWEILRDLIAALGGGNEVHGVEEVFKQMASETPALSGLSLAKIGDLGVQLQLPELAPRYGVEPPRTAP